VQFSSVAVFVCACVIACQLIDWRAAAPDKMNGHGHGCPVAVFLLPSANPDWLLSSALFAVPGNLRHAQAKNKQTRTDHEDVFATVLGIFYQVFGAAPQESSAVGRADLGHD